MPFQPVISRNARRRDHKRQRVQSSEDNADNADNDRSETAATAGNDTSNASHKSRQDAQLSQRDRAAGCVIVFAKGRKLELGDNILRTV